MNNNFYIKKATDSLMATKFVFGSYINVQRLIATYNGTSKINLLVDLDVRSILQLKWVNYWYHRNFERFLVELIIFMWYSNALAKDTRTQSSMTEAVQQATLPTAQCC